MTVEGVAQVKIKGDADAVRAAAEHFLSKSPGEIEEIAREVLVGHVQTTLGTVTIEEVRGDRDAFARRVRERWAEDMGKRGLEVISFAIRDVRKV